MGGQKHKRHPRLIGYDAEAVPEGGAQVYASLTALGRSYAKDAAGHIFHLFALKQAGLYGGCAAAGGRGRGGAGRAAVAGSVSTEAACTSGTVGSGAAATGPWLTTAGK